MESGVLDTNLYGSTADNFERKKKKREKNLPHESAD